MSNIMMSPCFYCNKPATHFGDVDKVNDKLEVVDVCLDHFNLASSS